MDTDTALQTRYPALFSFDFEYGELLALQDLIPRSRQEFSSAESFLDARTQALGRLYNSLLLRYTTLKSKLRKELCSPAREKIRHDSPVTPLLPDPWKTDIVLFAREALHLELFPHQQELCLSSSRVNILIAGRGAGKSAAAHVKAIHSALAEPYQTVLVVSSGQRMSSDFGTQLLGLIRDSLLRDHIQTISQEQVTFKNGSTIKLLPANPDTIRGYHPRSGSPHRGMTVILDEACFMDQGEEIRKAVEYALITTDSGQLYIVSSPSTIASWVYEYVKMAEDPNSGIHVIQCASTANPNISAEEIARLRATKNELEFKAEVLGEWVDGAYGLFSGIIEPNIIDPAEPLPQCVDYAIGVDLALSFSPSHDRNALAVVARWYEKYNNDENDEALPHYRLVEMLILGQASDSELRSELKRLIRQYQPLSACIEQYQGKSLAEYCQSFNVETRLIAPTPGLQQMAFHEIHQLLRHQRLQLPASLPQTFFDEMRAFEYRREANGHISFGHPGGTKMHDDTCYALAWAVHAANTAPPRILSPPTIFQFLP